MYLLVDSTPNIFGYGARYACGRHVRKAIADLAGARYRTSYLAPYSSAEGNGLALEVVLDNVSVFVGLAEGVVVDSVSWCASRLRGDAYVKSNAFAVQDCACSDAPWSKAVLGVGDIVLGG